MGAMEREARYCTSADGTRMAYTIYGENRGLDDLPLVGFDGIEVAPAYDSAGITALLAANR